MALNVIAVYITDYLMLNLRLLPEEHRRLYQKWKIIDSEDFTKLQERLDFVEKEQQKRAKKFRKGLEREKKEMEERRF